MKKIFYAFSLAFCLAASLAGCKEKDMSMKMNNPRNIKGVISYKRSFGDLNDAHLSAAQRIGVSPLQNRAAAEKLGKKVVEIKSGKYYQVDSLTHSIPFLVPRASALLDSFINRVQGKGHVNENEQSTEHKGSRQLQTELW